MMQQFRRIFVRKKPLFRGQSQILRNDISRQLGLEFPDFEVLSVYDLQGFDDALLEAVRYTVFGERATDEVLDEFDLSGKSYIAAEYLPGQFDQRASSALDCVRLCSPGAKVGISSSRLYVFGDVLLSPADRRTLVSYLVNPVDSREKDLSVFDFSEQSAPAKVPVLEGFTSMEDDTMADYCSSMGLAMNEDDLREVVKYFKGDGRDPYETELRILDTYWSDHCRHTTFTTVIDDISIDPSIVSSDIKASLDLYNSLRVSLSREDKPLCLMDLATIGAKALRAKGLLDDLEVSGENNACSIFVDVDVDGKTERWILMFKNETHNHPTEIEPFGGAATCLGGAIRDPLSGRSYVYQAMRVTGAGDITAPVSETLPGKLPQSVISRDAAKGYSSYGNQIGLATGHVTEIFHPGYVAKRMEIGAVAGAVPADRVRREVPAPGDVIFLIGGRTGRDGIGGATGSSKTHSESSLATCGSEVQKGNPPEERKLQRLFRRPEVTRLIKRCNDFGAGGVSVAIGELADGLDIFLDKVPVKYLGLNATELAISESQERMAVVVEASSADVFAAFCSEENLEATCVATVTDTARMRMFFHGEKVADLSRAFIDSAGASRHTKAVIAPVENKDPFKPVASDKPLKDRVLEHLSDIRFCLQKGLGEQFDSTIGRSTVLLPYGGFTQLTPTQVSVQKFPTDGLTYTSSIMSWGFDPYLSEWSPYHGAAFAVVHACAKVVAAGGDYRGLRLSFQEYFERMSSDPHTWGKPLSALLGALKMQMALSLPAIGGKDSMSGSFEHIHVPPTLVAFAAGTVDARRVISPELKFGGNSIYLVEPVVKADYMPDTEAIMQSFDAVVEATSKGKIAAAYALGSGGVVEAISKMCIGNMLGADIEVSEDLLFCCPPGSLIVESWEPLDLPFATKIGAVTEGELRINGQTIKLNDVKQALLRPLSAVYPVVSKPDFDRVTPSGVDVKQKGKALKYSGKAVRNPLVYIPVFPGTNCDYDTAKAFRQWGAEVEFGVFRNLDERAIEDSIEKMADALSRCHILALCGGFSAGDEPDGSGKYIASILTNERIARRIQELLDRDGLILGICNGFQALAKSGLLPFGKIGQVGPDSPTLFRNDIGRHVSTVVTTRVASTASPWLAGMHIGDLHTVAVSHGEGKFVVNEDVARQLFSNGQIAFQYADPESGKAVMASPMNPNGSYYAIEGIISPDGKILGKMGHTERFEAGLYRNIVFDAEQELFFNAVRYFRDGAK